jgi:transposase-like protein
VGTLIHAVDGLYEALCQPTMGLSDHQLIRRLYPTIKPDEEAMYATIIGQVKQKGSLPVAQAMREIDIAHAQALDNTLQQHRQQTGGWTQPSWLDSTATITPEERLLQARNTPEYQSLLAALTSAWQQPARSNVDLSASMRAVGAMREVTIVDNQGEKNPIAEESSYGRLQVRGRLDRVWFGRDPKTGKIGVEVNDLKTGKGGDSETLTFQMNLMGLVANRFAQGLVKSHQAAHGHGREPAGFVRGEGAFRVMRDINWNKWDERLLGVVVRRIDLQDGVFVEESVDLSLQAREKFHQQYSALCQEVGKQRGIIGFLLGRKSPK